MDMLGQTVFLSSQSLPEAGYSVHISFTNCQNVCSYVLLHQQLEVEMRNDSRYILSHAKSGRVIQIYCLAEGDFQKCSTSKYLRFCSKKFQAEDWPSHKQLCKAIRSLPSVEECL